MILSDKEIREKEGWRLSKSFKFTLTDTTNILTIKDEVDIVNLLAPYAHDITKNYTRIPVYKYVIDWKNLANDYDAIEALTAVMKC